MASKPKVFITQQDYRADYKVFFVEQLHQEKNAGLIAGAELVEQEYRADVKIFLVQQEYRADIKITRKNFAKK